MRHGVMINMSLSTDEFIRYQRQINLPQVSYAGQKKLKAAAVLIVGIGGLGCPVSLYLASGGVGRLGLVDHDTVDKSNLHRQILYTETDIGTLKTVAAKRKLLEHNSDCNITIYNEKITATHSNIIVNDYDIIVDCSDNFATRYYINQLARKLRKTLISAAIDRNKGQVSIFPQYGNSCYACLFEQIDPRNIKNCNEAGVLGTTAGIIALIQAQHIIHAILNPSSSSYLLQFNASTFSLKKFDIPQNPQCTVCHHLNTMKDP